MLHALHSNKVRAHLLLIHANPLANQQHDDSPTTASLDVMQRGPTPLRIASLYDTSRAQSQSAGGCIHAQQHEWCHQGS